MNLEFIFMIILYLFMKMLTLSHLKTISNDTISYYRIKTNYSLYPVFLPKNIAEKS